MTVVGHVDQLRQSRCWKESQLTCTTCHNPHQMPGEPDRVAYYRAICLNCHSQDKCTTDPQTRLKTKPTDNCVTCHMPTSDTEIPHLAFTHHRIGIHKPVRRKEESNVNGPGKLVAINDLSGWSKLDQDRMLGLAWLEVASNKGGPLAADRRQMAFRLLSNVWDRGIRDSATASGLLALTAGSRDPRVRQFISAIEDDLNCPPDVQLNGLLGQALMHAQSGQLDEAVGAMKKIVARRRVSGDWVLLAEFLDRQGNRSDCMKSLEHALEIEPLQPNLRRALIDYYLGENRKDRAEWHRIRLPLPVQRHTP